MAGTKLEWTTWPTTIYLSQEVERRGELVPYMGSCAWFFSEDVCCRFLYEPQYATVIPLTDRRWGIAVHPYVATRVLLRRSILKSVRRSIAFPEAPMEAVACITRIPRGTEREGRLIIFAYIVPSYYIVLRFV